MDDRLAELEARLDGLRLALVMVIRGLDDPTQALAGLWNLERHGRAQNMHAGAIEEISNIRAALDDL